MIFMEYFFNPNPLKAAPNPIVEDVAPAWEEESVAIACAVESVTCDDAGLRTSVE